MNKIGIIGCGKWSDNVKREIEKNKNFDLKAITCRNKYYLNKKNTKIYSNYKKMIESENLDCLYVAADPKVNFDVMKFISKRKMPIIFEKPLCYNYEEAKFFLENAKNNKHIILNNLPNIYSETFSETKKFYDLNKSNIKKINIIEGGKGPIRNNMNPIQDWSTHSISFILKLSDEKIKKIKYKILNYKNSNLFNILYNIKLETKINIKILNGNNFKKKIRYIKFYLNNGEIYYNDLINHKIYFKNQHLFTNTFSPLSTLLKEFNNNIHNTYTKSNYETLKIAAETVKIIEKQI